MRPTSCISLVLCLLAPPVCSSAEITPEHVAFFTGCWQGEGRFANGRETRATVNVSTANVPGALVYAHDDIPPGRFRSTALWASRNGATYMTETNSSGGYRVFAATETSTTRIVFTSRGQLDDLLGANAGAALRQERFIYEVTSPDTYRMSYEVVREGTAWSQVDFVDFKRCSTAK